MMREQSAAEADFRKMKIHSSFFREWKIEFDPVLGSRSIESFNADFSLYSKVALALVQHSGNRKVFPFSDNNFFWQSSEKRETSTRF